MDNNQTNSRSAPKKEVTSGDTAVYKTESSPHFKRALVPLDEYAEREGISSDTAEQQGRLGVIQIRKFKGQKFVVDVPPEQLSEYENEDTPEIIRKSARLRTTNVSKLFTAGLTAALIIIIVGVFWLYMDAKTKLDDAVAENKSIRSMYNDLSGTSQNLNSMQEQLAAAKAEFAGIQNRIGTSKTELEKIQGDLNKTKRNLDAIQSELASIQGQMSLSKVEIESIQNSLNENKNQLDILSQQNAPSVPK